MKYVCYYKEWDNPPFFVGVTEDLERAKKWKQENILKGADYSELPEVEPPLSDINAPWY